MKNDKSFWNHIPEFKIHHITAEKLLGFKYLYKNQI